jgi:hypothetical protein
LQDPGSAVAKACQWRAAVLAALCSDSLGAVAEALKEKGPPRSWQFKQQHAGISSKYGMPNRYLYGCITPQRTSFANTLQQQHECIHVGW